MRLEQLSKVQQAELCRISQQGMLQAAEVLGQMLRQPVTVKMADAWMSDCMQTEQADENQLGICMQVSGDINGRLLLTLSERSADWLSRLLLRATESQVLLEEPASSTLKEVGNIIASSFLACLDDQLGLRAMPSPPELCTATVDKLLEGCRQSNSDEACLVVRTELLGTADADSSLQGAIYLIPDSAVLEKLLAKIGCS